jgi:hypothetical protein
LFNQKNQQELIAYWFIIVFEIITNERALSPWFTWPLPQKLFLSWVSSWFPSRSTLSVLSLWSPQGLHDVETGSPSLLRSQSVPGCLGWAPPLSSPPDPAELVLQRAVSAGPAAHWSCPWMAWNQQQTDLFKWTCPSLTRVLELPSLPTNW